MKLKYTILWIEDDETYLENRKEDLIEKDSSLNVILSTNGKDIEKNLDEPLDMVVCDYNLEDRSMTGIDIIKKIREKNKYCKVIFYTGYMDDIKLNELIELIKYNIYRFEERDNIEDVVFEEIGRGNEIISIIDRWLTYYDKNDETLSFLGDNFKEKRLSEIAKEVRLQTKQGQDFINELTKVILTVIWD